MISSSTKTRLISVSIPLVLLVIFVIQNIELIHVRFLFWDLSMPRSVMIFTVLVIGIVVGVVFRSTIVASIKRRIK